MFKTAANQNYVHNHMIKPGQHTMQRRMKMVKSVLTQTTTVT